MVIRNYVSEYTFAYTYYNCINNNKPTQALIKLRRVK